jgi:hypothetical protein
MPLVPFPHDALDSFRPPRTFQLRYSACPLTYSEADRPASYARSTPQTGVSDINLTDNGVKVMAENAPKMVGEGSA